MYFPGGFAFEELKKKIDTLAIDLGARGEDALRQAAKMIIDRDNEIAELKKVIRDLNSEVKCAEPGCKRIWSRRLCVEQGLPVPETPPKFCLEHQKYHEVEHG